MQRAGSTTPGAAWHPQSMAGVGFSSQSPFHDTADLRYQRCVGGWATLVRLRRTGTPQQRWDQCQSAEYDGEGFVFLLFFSHVQTMKPASSYLEPFPGFSIQTPAIANRLTSPPSGKF